MDKLPCDIINNILIIKYEAELKELKEELRKLKFQYEQIERTKLIMENYLDTHEVKYCDCCDIYGDDDEIIYYEDFNEHLCEYCLEFREENQ